MNTINKFLFVASALALGATGCANNQTPATTTSSTEASGTVTTEDSSAASGETSDPASIETSDSATEGSAEEQEVERNQFLQATANLPAKTYSSATVVGYIETFLGTIVVNAEYSYTEEDGWLGVSGNYEAIEINVVGLKVTDEGADPAESEVPEGVTVSYFLNPISIVSEGTFTQTMGSDMTFELGAYGQVIFDEFGFCIYSKSTTICETMPSLATDTELIIAYNE